MSHAALAIFQFFLCKRIKLLRYQTNWLANNQIISSYNVCLIYLNGMQGYEL